MKHYLHSSLEKSLIKRVMQYFKNGTECFDDYYPSNNNKQNCDLQAIQLDQDIHICAYNTTITNNMRIFLNLNLTKILFFDWNLRGSKGNYSKV